MSESLFDRVAEMLEERTVFNRLEARGTLRIALREAGLEPRGLDAAYTRAVLEKILPRELHERGILDAPALCASIAAAIQGADSEEADAQRPEGLFQRLGSR